MRPDSGTCPTDDSPGGPVRAETQQGAQEYGAPRATVKPGWPQPVFHLTTLCRTFLIASVTVPLPHLWITVWTNS